jgi:hypothetical protein
LSDSYIQLSGSFKSIRKLPLNLKKEDEAIFQHEVIHDCIPGYLLELEDIFYTGYGSVVVSVTRSLPKEFIFYNSIKVHSFLSFLFFICNKRLKSRYKIIREPVIFIADIRSNNYFHWIGEVLPRLLEAKEKIGKYSVILPTKFRDLNFVSDSLNYIGLSFRFMEKFSLYKLKHIFFVSHFSVTGNYNDEIIKRTGKALQSVGKADERNQRIYISRSKADRRKIINEAELTKILIEHNFKIIYCEELSFSGQASIFSDARILISIHGAGLTNMIFMSPGAAVLELRYQNDRHSNCYFSLASALDINYYYQQCPPVNPESDPYRSDLIVDAEIFKALLLQICNSK